MQHALAVHDLVVALERLAADAVPPLVGPLVEVVGPAGEDALDQRPDAGLVRRIGGADELIVRDAEPLPHRAERVRELVHELLRRNAPLLRGLRHLLPVLVHADEKVHVIAPKPVVPRHRVGADLLQAWPKCGSPLA